MKNQLLAGLKNVPADIEAGEAWAAGGEHPQWISRNTPTERQTDRGRL